MILHSQDLDFRAIRQEFDLPGGYPEQARRQAAEAVDRFPDERRDATDIPLVTIDPVGARDLDQAVHIESIDGGYRVHYAIADVAAFVEPGSALENESLHRGQTLYLPDGIIPLHPSDLAEGAASLLPEATRPAALWTVEVDEHGQTRSATVERATVRSVARLDYARVQSDADAGTLHPSISGLPAVGRILRERGVRAGAINLRLPAQEVVRTAEGWELRVEPRVAADEWNAQISLLVGRAAADIMLTAGCGLLRTLPEAEPEVVAELRTDAGALGIDWPAELGVGRMLDSVDPNTPTGMAMMRMATKALRGADYVQITGDGPAQPSHAGIGGTYAHVTAPIRRVVDRYATEVCLARCADRPVPDWVGDRLPELSGLMRRSDRLASAVERACVDYAEAVALQGLVGQTRQVVVIREPAGDRAVEVFCADPAVFGDCSGDVEVGTAVSARIAEVDVAARRILFAVDGARSAGNVDGRG